MMTKNNRFGELLKEGFASVAHRQHISIGEVDARVAELLGYGKSTVQRQKAGYVPSEDVVTWLVRYCVENSRVGRDWAYSTLVQAGHSQCEGVLATLFPKRERPLERKCYQNVPPADGSFLGRKADLTWVLTALASRWPVVSLEGMGGIGKTMLAQEVARQALRSASTLPFEAVVWVSAKDRPEQKIWLNEILDTVARVLDYPAITQQEHEQKLWQIDQQLRQIGTLIVIDNYETIDDPDLEQWLCNIPEPSKCLITGRYAQLRSAYAKHLRGLMLDDALDLIRQHAIRLHLDALAMAPQATLLPLVEVTDGNPKAIVLALGYVKRGMLSLGEVVEHLHHASQTVNDVFEYLFEQAWALLGENGRSLLLTIPLFADTASKEAIGATANLNGYALDKGLGQLVDWGFLDAHVTTEQTRYSAHPLVRAFAGRQAYPTKHTRMLTSWQNWYKAFLLQHQGEDWHCFIKIDPERENIFHYLRLIGSTSESVYPLMIKCIWHYLYVRGYWQISIDLTEHSICIADDVKNLQELSIWLKAHNAWLLHQCGEIEESIQILKELENFVVNKDELALFCGVYNFLSQCFLLKGYLNEAERYETKHLHLAQAFDDKQEILTAEYYLTRMALQRGEVKYAKEKFHFCLEEAHKIQWERAVGYFTYRLGTAYTALGNYEQAEIYLRESLMYAEKWQEPLLKAQFFVGMGLLYESKGLCAKALQLAYQAKELYEKLNTNVTKMDVNELFQKLDQISAK